MLVNFACACGKPLRAESQYAGQRVKCPECGAGVVVPSDAGLPPSPGMAPVVRPGASGTCGLATASLVLSLVGICFVGFILGPLAVVLGIIAVNQVARDPMLSGKGSATAGIVIGAFVSLINIAFLAFYGIFLLRLMHVW